MYQKLIEAINDCDMLLIGIGQEVSLFDGINLKDNIEREKWNESILNKDSHLQEEVIEFYNDLENVISKKNYFIITTNVDGLIYESRLNPLRIVAPCGNIKKLQCKCEENIIDTPDNFYEGRLKLVCEKCKAEYVPNVFNKESYNENGYLKQWNLYNKWLQGTLNKKLVVLEIGCDFSWLSIIRMPFEKVVLINQKSLYYRVNSRFPQITAELSERMFSIPDNPFVFSKNITKRY